MTTEQFVRRNLRMYQRLAAKQRTYAECSDDPIERSKYLAAASVYTIAADDMREILEDADDMNAKRPARVDTTDEPKGDGFLYPHHPEE